MYKHGWYQIGFSRDTSDVTPIEFGSRRWMLIKRNDALKVYDATCPHRGAHLGFGGKLSGDSVVCPFHGYRIALGDDSQREFCVQEYETYERAGLVFVRASEDVGPSFPEALDKLSDTYTFIPGFSMDLKVDAQLAIENAFDNAHFQPVHGLCREPVFETCEGEFGEFAVRGVFHIPPSDWEAKGDSSKPIEVGFLARAFSPGLVVSELLGEFPYDYAVISAAVPTPEPNRCTIRLSVGLRTHHGPDVHQSMADPLLEFSRAGLVADGAVWEKLLPDIVPRWTEKDQCVRAFTEFCERFHEKGVSNHS